MKANELRIGNLVTVNNPEYYPKLKGVILRVTSISPNRDDYSIGLEHINQKPNTYYQSYSQFIKFIEPIAISEKLIVEFGFENNELELGRWTFAKFWFNVKSGQLRLVDKSGLLLTHDNLKCVHQLQNLYFALRNEELAIV